MDTIETSAAIASLRRQAETLDGKADHYEQLAAMHRASADELKRTADTLAEMMKPDVLDWGDTDE